MMNAAMLMVAATLGQAAQPSPKAPRPDVRCGGFCLFVGLQALEVGQATFAELEKGLGPPGPRGYSMRELQVAAERAGASAMAVETSLDNLRFRDRPFAVIGILNDDHYVLINDITAARVSVIDPPRSYETTLDAFRTVWNGKALLIGKTPLATEESVKRRRIIAQNWPTAAAGLGVLVLAPLCILLVRRSRGARASVTASVPILAGLALLSCGGCDHAGPVAPPTNAAAATVVAEAPTVGQWLFIPEERKDLGTILKREDQQEASFQIALENRGPSILEIGKITTSCACTRASLSQRRIPPGGSSTLTAFVRVGDNLAANSARIYVPSSDPVAPQREIFVSWQVDVPLRTDQTSLNLPPLSPGEGAERTLPIRLKGLALCPSCRLQAQSGSQTATCAVDPLPAERSESHDTPLPDDEFRVVSQLRFRVHPQAEENFYRDAAHIDLFCGADRRAGFTLPVTWSVAPVVQAAPGRVYFGVTKPGEAFTRRVVLHSRSGQPFRLIGIDPGERIALVGPLASATTDAIHHLELAVRAPATEGPCREVAHVRTDHPGGDDIVLSFSGIVAQEGTGP